MVGRHSTHEFASVGELELKGIPDPVPAVEVRGSPRRPAGDIPMPSRLVGTATEGLFGFFGRSDELDHPLDAAKRARTEGHPEVVLLEGEPGIGKTTLAAQVARTLHADGATVLFGQCSEGMGVPYRPWIDALTHLVEHAPEQLLDAHVEQHGAALARLVPALARRVPAAAPNGGSVTPTATATSCSRRCARCSVTAARDQVVVAGARRPAVGRRREPAGAPPHDLDREPTAAAGGRHVPRHRPHARSHAHAGPRRSPPRAGRRRDWRSAASTTRSCSRSWRVPRATSCRRRRAARAGAVPGDRRQSVLHRRAAPPPLRDGRDRLRRQRAVLVEHRPRRHHAAGQRPRRRDAPCRPTRRRRRQAALDGRGDRPDLRPRGAEHDRRAARGRRARRARAGGHRRAGHRGRRAARAVPVRARADRAHPVPGPRARRVASACTSASRRALETMVGRARAAGRRARAPLAGGDPTRRRGQGHRVRAPRRRRSARRPRAPRRGALVLAGARAPGAPARGRVDGALRSADRPRHRATTGGRPGGAGRRSWRRPISPSRPTTPSGWSASRSHSHTPRRSTTPTRRASRTMRAALDRVERESATRRACSPRSRASSTRATRRWSRRHARRSRSRSASATTERCCGCSLRPTAPRPAPRTSRSERARARIAVDLADRLDDGWRVHRSFPAPQLHDRGGRPGSGSDAPFDELAARAAALGLPYPRWQLMLLESAMASMVGRPGRGRGDRGRCAGARRHGRSSRAVWAPTAASCSCSGSYRAGSTSWPTSSSKTARRCRRSNRCGSW